MRATIASHITKDGLDSLYLDMLAKAIKQSLKGDSLLMTAQQSQMAIQTYIGDKQKQKADLNIAAGKKFLEENKKKPGVITLPDGVQYIVLKEGNGPMPAPTDTVVTNYHGTN